MTIPITRFFAFRLHLAAWILAVHSAFAALLPGSIIGTPGSWQNSGNTITNVFDGDITTFFDAPDPGTGDWAGLDFGPGAANIITSIVYAPRAGFGGRMVGGQFQGANQPDFSDAVNLGTINNAPADGTYITVPVTVQTGFRYARYLAPDPSWGNISELQFFGYGPGVNLALAQPALASSASDATHTPALAVDGKVSTGWLSSGGGPQWLSVDLGSGYSVGSIQISWGSNYASTFTVQSSTDGTTWKDQFTKTGFGGGLFLATFKPFVTRYLRINCTQAGGAGGYGIQELSVLGVVTAPVLNDLAPAQVTSHGAVATGQIVATGGLVPTVILYYGAKDGGSQASAWGSFVNLGQQSANFSAPITGLNPSTTYYYTFAASNAAGVTWASPSVSFTTAPPPQLPGVVNLAALGVQPNTATVAGRITSTGGGGEIPTAFVYYGIADGGTSANAWTFSQSAGPQSTNFVADLTGLTPNTTYFFTVAASNSAGIVWASPSLSFTTPLAPPAVPVLTYHYDNTRQGANLSENLLTPANVGGGTFGRLFTYPVDGHVYAQPLIMTNVAVLGKGTRNVLLVASQHDSLYAFDADNNGGPDNGLLWKVNFGVSAATPNNDWGNRYGPYHDIDPEVGITATPVIDPVTSTIYLDVFSHEGTVYLHRIHALDIATGTERPFSPVPVAAQVPGKGVGSAGGVLNFDSRRSLNRSAFTLAGGILFATYTGYADTDPYHGWVIGFDAATLKPLTNYVFCTSPNSTINAWGPNAGECGIWMAGHGPCADANNNLFFEVGNGPFNANAANGSEYGDSFVRLSSSSGLSVADYFTPYNQASLAAADADLGSGGPIILPDSVGSAAHPHLLVGCGKEGKIYLLDRDQMGHYNPANDNGAVQTLPGAVGGTWSSPAYFNGTIYYQGSGDVLKAFSIANGAINPNPVGRGPSGDGYPGSTPVISASGTQNAIVWTIQSDAYGGGGPAVLHAYNATNITYELYNSSRNLSRDNPGGAVKYTVPVVANGKVYVPAQFGVAVYGLGTFLATPSISPNGGIFTNSVQVSISDTTPGTAIYYTIDGTTPGTNSSLYVGPFTLTNSASVQAVATIPGAINSAVASAGFLNLTALGSGKGLLGEYWSTTPSANPYPGPATLLRLDPTVDFDWGNGSPDPSISANQFTARWTGSIEAQYSETYTFYLASDDGARLFINGRELINQWVDQALTEVSGSIALRAGQRYNIEVDYYQNTGADAVHLSWSSPSTPKAIIPQSQLYAAPNPGPGIALNAPTNAASFTAPASVTFSAAAAAQNNSIDYVSFYLGTRLIANVLASPYTFTTTGLGVGNYSVTAVAVDATGLKATSPPVNITITSGSGLPYGLAVRPSANAYFNLPTTVNGTLPALLSQSGVFSDTPSRTVASGFIPYQPLVQFWSDGAIKSRYFAVPYSDGLVKPDHQIAFATDGEWSFPAGSVFVKNFDIATDETNTNSPLRRIETRVLVRDSFGAVYGVTYKWRPNNSEADLLTTSQEETLLITNAFGVRSQTWYYPSPADCLTCHTPAANYVLGLKTRQLNHDFGYSGTGVHDNQLRTLNHLGLFYPAIDESTIPTLPTLVALSDTNAPIQSRARSYIDANCANCHRPDGVRANFDARYDTPIEKQNMINGIVLGNLGVDRAAVVVPQDLWRSVLYQRVNSLEPLIKMPPLARNRIDTNGVQLLANWINSLPGVPAIAPPTILPDGGQFALPVTVSLQHPDANALLHFTLDDTLPTTNSPVYSGPFLLRTNAILQAKAFETGFSDSIASTAFFTVATPVYFTANPYFQSGSVHLPFSGVPGRSYILQGTADLKHWVPVNTNLAPDGILIWLDPASTNLPYQFYRVIEGR